jgi:hypothetical protein
MSGCATCGAPTGRRYCRECELAQRDTEPVGGTASDDDGQWCQQAGLGDHDAAGQTDLEGDLVREAADGDE